MPKVDFRNIDDSDDFAPLPAGVYVAEVKSIDASKPDRSGNELWRMEHRILEPLTYRERKVWDNLSFSPAALKRVKLICSRLGLDTSGELDLTPAMLLGRKFRLRLEVESYHSEKLGREAKRNTVPFQGYEELNGDSPKIDPDVPF